MCGVVNVSTCSVGSHTTDNAHSQRVCGLHTGDASHFLKKTPPFPADPKEVLPDTVYIVCAVPTIYRVCCAGEKSSQ